MTFPIYFINIYWQAQLNIWMINQMKMAYLQFSVNRKVWTVKIIYYYVYLLVSEGWKIIPTEMYAQTDMYVLRQL